jgi:flagellin
LAVAVQIVSSAKTAALTYQGGNISGNTVTLQVAGNLGSTQLSFASGTTVSSIATAINGVKTSTGLSAQVSGTALRVNSTQYGSAQYTSISVISGKLKSAFSGTKATGTDAKVTVNGATAQVAGLDVSYRNSSLDVSFNILNALDKPSPPPSTLPVAARRSSWDRRSARAARPPSASSRSRPETSAMPSTDTSARSAAAEPTASRAATCPPRRTFSTAPSHRSAHLRGRLGAFQTFTIGSTVNSLGVAFENVSAAESAITDTDFASETSNLTRDQILSTAATTVLQQANAQPQNVLKLSEPNQVVESRGGATDFFSRKSKVPRLKNRGILFALAQ